MPEPGLSDIPGIDGIQQLGQQAQQRPGGDHEQRSPSGNVEVSLGDVVVPVYPQRHAYLMNRLGRTLAQFAASTQGEINTENFVSFLGGNTYDVLAALIPALPSRLPRHVFMGYESEEAAEKGDYDETKDKSPDLPQIIGAFEACIRVNRFDVLGGLKAIVDPTLLRAYVRKEMAQRLSATSQS
jgi:hypothetical protein